MKRLPESPTDYTLRGRIGGVSNVVKNGRKKAVAPAAAGLASKYRRAAIEAGAKSEQEIQNAMADMRRLQSLKAAAARWKGEKR
jgi:hypothetical protein